MFIIEIVIGFIISGTIFLAYIGYNVISIISFLAFLILLYLFLNKKDVMNLSFSNSQQISNEIGVKLEDIGGQNIAKKELTEALDFIIHSQKTEDLGIRPLKGILLTGPPGTGKTMLAKAAATYTDSVFLASSGSEFVEMYAGVGAQRIRNLFKRIRSLAKKQNKNRAIIFIDEIEVLGRKRGNETNHMEYDQTLNQLLVEMDGIKNSLDIKVLVIAATNRVDMLDSALLRPGRFDRQVKVDLPDKEGRLQILKLYVKNKPLGNDISLDSLAQETFGFSGAHLESVVNEAAIYALRENSNEILQKYFKDAIDKVMLGEILERKPSKSEIKRIAIHEIGHAILCEYGNPGLVANVTITPRGQALGYMRQKQKNDIYLYTKEEIFKQINISLAGACAEEQILGDKSTGSANDFQEALKLAKQIITTGLSELGIVDNENDKQIINEKAKEIIKTQMDIVRNVIELNQSKLSILAEYLIEKEKISGEELRKNLSFNNCCA